MLTFCSELRPCDSNYYVVAACTVQIMNVLENQPNLSVATICGQEFIWGALSNYESLEFYSVVLTVTLQYKVLFQICKCK